MGRPVARRVLCAALGAALCVRCGVPGAVLFARFAAPDGALSQTSARLRAASWAWRASWWSGLPPADTVKIAGEATSPNTAAYPRKARALRRQTRFGSERSAHLQAPGLLPESMSPEVESLAD